MDTLHLAYLPSSVMGASPNDKAWLPEEQKFAAALGTALAGMRAWVAGLDGRELVTVPSRMSEEWVRQLVAAGADRILADAYLTGVRGLAAATTTRKAQDQLTPEEEALLTGAGSVAFLYGGAPTSVAARTAQATAGGQVSGEDLAVEHAVQAGEKAAVAYVSARLLGLLGDRHGLESKVRELATAVAQGRMTLPEAQAQVEDLVVLGETQARRIDKVRHDAVETQRKQGASAEKAQAAGEKAAEKRRESTVRVRTETVTRTEVVTAENQGGWDATQLAVESGLLDPRTRKEWLTADDERTCPICAALSGEIVRWDQPFSNGAMVPGGVHPRCRCTAGYLGPEK